MRNSRAIRLALPLLLAACACVSNAVRRNQRLALLDEELQAAAPAEPALPSGAPAWPMAHGHSHNDYAQKHPLADALALGYRSVEADIWWSGGELKISHHGWFYDGTLRDLYLAPLQARVDKLGSVYGDGAPFLLWIDVKDRDPHLMPALHQLLADYPMIAASDPAGAASRPGAVTAVLTGDKQSKEAYARQPGVHYALRDAGGLPRGDASDSQDSQASTVAPPQWSTLNWNDWFSWDGSGEMPTEERTRLRTLVARAHGLGRKLRLYALPESEALWAELLRAGVDLIGTDELPRLQAFLEEHMEHRPPEHLAGAAASLRQKSAPSR